MAGRDAHGAIIELSRRLRDTPLVDNPDAFAEEYVAWLNGQGWRRTNAPPPLPSGEHQHPFIPGANDCCVVCDYPEPNRRHLEVS